MDTAGSQWSDGVRPEHLAEMDRAYARGARGAAAVGPGHPRPVRGRRGGADPGGRARRTAAPWRPPPDARGSAARGAPARDACARRTAAPLGAAAPGTPDRRLLRPPRLEEDGHPR